MPGITERSPNKPLIRSTFLSHGTLEVIDLQASRTFYEEVLGLEFIQTSEVSGLLRMGGHHTYAVVETGSVGKGGFGSHNGVDVATKEEVDEAHTAISKVKDQYGIKRINPVQRQHGAYAFYLVDRDDNWWEILYNPVGGYSRAFEDTGADITGLHDWPHETMDHTLEEEVRLRVAQYKGRTSGQDPR